MDSLRSSGLKLSVTASLLLLVAFLFSSNGNKKHLSATEDDDQLMPIVGAVGPESFAFDPNGEGPYTGVSDGRIIKWQQNESRWVDFAVTSPHRDGCGAGGGINTAIEHKCGRPLGLLFNKNSGELFVTDPYMGLLTVKPNGGLPTVIANQAEGIPFNFINGLDIDHTTGVVYFTESSTKYQRRNHLCAIVTGDNTGRVMKYDPETKQTTVILHNLTFPNGIALSKDGNFLLISETSACRILKFWLKTPKAGEVEILTELPGFPDNIKMNHKGEFWVAINSERTKLMKWAFSKPWIGNALVKLPFDITKAQTYMARVGAYSLGMRINENGDVLEVLKSMNNGKKWIAISEIEEENGKLWIGSVIMPFAIKQRYQSR